MTADPATVPFEVYAINNRDVMVGGGRSPHDENHAFLSQAGRITDLGTLGGRESLATGINEAGQVIGYSTTAKGATHSFIWQDGKMTDLGTLFGDQSMPVGINAEGEIVGNVFGPAPASKPVTAYVWHDGRLTKIGRIHGDVPIVVGINDKGQILVKTYRDGRSSGAYLLSGRRSIAMPYSGGVSGHIVGPSDLGQVAGTTTVNNVRRIFIWQDGKSILLPPSGGVDDVTAISANGDIIGESQNRGIIGVIWHQQRV